MYIICTAEVMSSKGKTWRRVSVDFNPTLCYFFSWGGGGARKNTTSIVFECDEKEIR